MIWLIGKAHSYLEFCQRKIFQYSNSPEHLKTYSAALENDINFPFYRRKRSSTKNIKSQWIEKFDFSEMPSLFDDYHCFTVPSNIEEKWNDVPSKLETNASIIKTTKQSNHELEGLLSQTLYPDLKVLFMSGYTADVIAHRGVLDADVHFTQKPFSIRDLVIKVREALGDWGRSI